MKRAEESCFYGARPRTVAEWLKWAKTKVSNQDAEIIALEMMTFSMKDRSWLVTHENDGINEMQWTRGNIMIGDRLKKMPMGYVMGEKEFYGRKFLVTPDVLIPRPETEDLIELVKELDLPEQVRILDMGTGSGCIAITLALLYPQARVVASDRSSEALVVAKKNDTCYEGRVRFVQSDLFAKLDDIDGIDVIVANLPYVNPNWDWLDMEALDYEPMMALYALRENGLSTYRKFFEDMFTVPWIGGVKYLVFEADPCQHRELIDMAEAFGWNLQEVRGYGLLFNSGD